MIKIDVSTCSGSLLNQPANLIKKRYTKHTKFVLAKAEQYAKTSTDSDQA